MDIYSQGMHDRSMRSGAELARENKVTDWSMAGNLFTGPLEYKYRLIFVLVLALFVLCEVQLDNINSI